MTSIVLVLQNPSGMIHSILILHCKLLNGEMYMIIGLKFINVLIKSLSIDRIIHFNPFKWTSVIHEHFYEQTKISCSIVYKYAKIYEEGQFFFKFSGHCSSCSSTLTGIMDKLSHCRITRDYQMYY